MSLMDCGELREVAAELALGTLPGDERAAAIGHLAQCAECQLRVEELSDVADSLLLQCPEADPPRGFGRRVVAGLQSASPRRRVVAALATGVLAVGIGIGLSTSVVRHDSSNSPFALHGRGVHEVQLAAAEGETVRGQVFLDADDPSWVFMTVRDSDGDGDETYTCQLITTSGRAIDIGSFKLHRGAGSWGRTIAVNTAALRTVRLVDSSGHAAASASLT